MRRRMQYAPLGALAIFAALMLLLPACGGKAKAVDQSSPKEACRTAMKGLVQFDKERLLQCVAGTAQEVAALGHFMDFMIAGRDFREAFLKEYGARAWDEFQDAAGVQVNVSIEGTPAEIDEKIEQAEFHVQDETCTMSYQGQSLHLTRTDGKWFLLARELTDVDPAKTRQIRAFTRVLRRHKARIGKRGVTPEQLDEEMGADFLESLRVEQF